ncbi:MAG TPA: histidinol-phosphate transaminase [Frankiaceae bacterium]|nr:histidinol-phosphate transaminase [Frankiaceae bacterium]
MTLPIRADLRGRAPYGAPQLDARVRLNTNENPYPPSPGLVADLAAAVTDAATTLNRYPDREAVALRADLAAYARHTPDGTWAANGSNEVLQQLLMAFGGPGRTALGFEPSYSMHRLISEATGTRWVSEQRADDFTLDAAAAVRAVERHRPDVVFLCSPNNPTATALPPEVVAAVYDATDGVVVVDEAYVEFSRAPSVAPLLAGRERLVVTRTMSKAFAMAGTRVGYLLSAGSVVDALRVVRLPYHLSALTQAAARVALAHAAETLATVELVRRDRDRLVAALDCTPSDANFVLFRVPDAAATWQALLDRGVLVRDVGLPGRLRVTVGTTEECDTFLEALGQT